MNPILYHRYVCSYWAAPVHSWPGQDDTRSHYRHSKARRKRAIAKRRARR